ncbi:energy-coupling factor ABC transporter substrate-binding protein [Carboxylicivirga marina]|uniref:Cobalt transport protein CbiN n=1 Tax=Carboxylicivirga marina TaxID=2800988 RepID=A0ABS1HKE4_9BACT|nr:energy-coupling factor ABC transporter substrate-binding protein [Carboxylicivirga marina]MBK3518071.1 energy-coupling factor ABC transporter substrate-binding protein [Carboxylicivirga marina]
MAQNKQFKLQNYILLIICLLIPIIALYVGGDSEFGGADGMAAELIDAEGNGYVPWIDNIWAPPGGETESLLFSLQSAIGAGVLFYFIGFIKGKKAGINAK